VSVFEYGGTLSAGGAVRWWTGGNGWYKHDNRPQLDAHPVPTFPEGIAYTGIGVPLWYGDFTCKLESSDFLGHDLYTYFVTIRNDGTDTCEYHMRVWVP
jgi:hypothetical protein